MEVYVVLTEGRYGGDIKIFSRRLAAEIYNNALTEIDCRIIEFVCDKSDVYYVVVSRAPYGGDNVKVFSSYSEAIMYQDISSNRIVRKIECDRS